MSLWEQWGNPRYVLAPMVNQSDLSFRLLVRRYGVTLTYTPMLNAGMLVKAKEKYLKTNLTLSEEDHPLVIQLAGYDPEIMAEAASIVADMGDAIDLNFGCPQNIAKSGKYGAYLLNDPERIIAITKAVVHRIHPKPVTVKLRLVGTGEDGVNETITIAKQCVEAGAKAICLHGRVKEAKGQQTGQADWDAIKRLKEAMPKHIPVIANGSISNLDEAKKCLYYTKADAVMSGEGLIDNPALFHEESIDQDKLMREYLDIARQKNEFIKAVKAHVFHGLYSGLSVHTDLRDRLSLAHNLNEIEEIANEMCRRRKGEKKRGWYYRYRKKCVA